MGEPDGSTHVIWVFAATALYLAVVSRGFRRFLFWTAGSALALFVFCGMFLH